MKLFNNGSPVEVTGALTETDDFEIVGTKETFRILSSGLYNDKALAIVRELSCNAYDAHVAADRKEVPFEIHLPTSFEPWFAIKDFGTGLSHDQIMGNKEKKIKGIYKTYFMSNKTQSNEYVGAFGLGSKSPFSYTEGFTVISRFDCREKIYSTYIQENGKPGILLQSDEWIDEDEPLFFLQTQTGLEINFPVKKYDIALFESAASRALEFFSPEPILNVGISIVKEKYQIKNDAWGLREGHAYHGNHSLRAIQGLVAYNVGIIDRSKLTKSAQEVAHLPLDLFFEIGQISPAASRESLSNDDRTILHIVGALDKVAEQFVERAKESFKEFKTKWEALAHLDVMTQTYGVGEFIRQAEKDGKFIGTYPNFTIDSTKLSINEFDYSSPVLYKFTENYKRKHDANKESLFHSKTKETKADAASMITKGVSSKDYYDTEISPYQYDLFVINDIKHGGEKYLHWHLQQGDNSFYPFPYIQSENYGRRKKSVYLISRISKDYTIERLISEAKKIVEKLGNPPIAYLSEFRDHYKAAIEAFNKPPVIPGSATVTPNREILWFDKNADMSRYNDGYERQGWKKAWKAQTALLPANRKFYVPLKSLKPADASFDFAESFKNFWLAAAEAQIGDLQQSDLIYGLQEQSNLRQQTDWIDFIPYVMNNLAILVTPAVELGMSLRLTKFNSHLDSTFAEFAANKLLLQDSPMQKFCDQLAKAEATKNYNVGLAKVIRRAIDLKKFTLTVAINFNEEYEKIKQVYPLIEQLDSYSYIDDPKIKAIQEYIQLIDEKNDKIATEEVVTLAMAVSQQQEEETINVN